MSDELDSTNIMGNTINCDNDKIIFKLMRNFLFVNKLLYLYFRSSIDFVYIKNFDFIDNCSLFKNIKIKMKIAMFSTAACITVGAFSTAFIISHFLKTVGKIIRKVGSKGNNNDCIGNGKEKTKYSNLDNDKIDEEFKIARCVYITNNSGEEDDDDLFKSLPLDQNFMLNLKNLEDKLISFYKSACEIKKRGVANKIFPETQQPEDKSPTEKIKDERDEKKQKIDTKQNEEELECIKKQLLRIDECITRLIIEIDSLALPPPREGEENKDENGNDPKEEEEIDKLSPYLRSRKARKSIIIKAHKLGDKVTELREHLNNK